MQIEQLLLNPWFVGVGSGLVGGILLPLLVAVCRRVRASLGPFSGQYMAFTWQPTEDEVLIEDVRCRHNGPTLSGTIKGVAFVEVDRDREQITERAPNTAVYRFHGSVDERTFVISYRTKIPGQHSVGALALRGDSSGTVFSGFWAGLVGEMVSHNECVWIRVKPRISPKRRRARFLDLAKAELLQLDRTDSWLDIPLYEHGKTMGKALLAKMSTHRIMHMNAAKRNYSTMIDSRLKQLKQSQEADPDAEQPTEQDE